MSDKRVSKIFGDKVTRKVIFLSLTFLISFAVFFAVDKYQDQEIRKCQLSIENQQSRSLLGKAVLNRLLMVELDLKKMVDAEEVRTVEILQGTISDNLAGISSILTILHNGGTFVSSLPANFYEFDQIDEEISFNRNPDDGYVVEVIELTPKMIAIEEGISGIALRKREQLFPGSNVDRVKMKEQLDIKYMKVETLVLRARESASKIFYDTQREIRRLTDYKQIISSEVSMMRYSLFALTMAVCILLFFRIFFGIRTVLNDREQKSRNLSEAKQTIETILDSIPVGMVVVNDRKEIVRVNSEALRLFEASSAEDILRKTCNNVFCLSPGMECPLETELSPSNLAEIKIRTHRGREVTVLKNATNIMLSGELVVLEAFMDISRRLEMEKQVQEEQNYANAVLQGVQAGVVVIDAQQHTIVDMNESAARLIGVKREEALGAVCHKYICPAEVGRCPVTDLKKNVDHAVRLLANGRSVLKSVVPFNRGENLYLLESFVDISDRIEVEEKLKKALEEADKASRAKSEFLSRMSHELRTPLNAVIGFSELLLDNQERSLTGRQTSQVEHIKVAGLHLMQMITKVLDFSRIESDNVSLTIEPVNMSDIIEECHVLLKQTAESNDITVSLDPELASLPPVAGDRTYLKQVMLNLMSNAIKYNRNGGRVLVGGHSGENNTVVLRVEDTGVGIPSEKQNEIFHPFTRFVSDDSDIEGTGIGMAISSQLVSSMNGEISVESMVGIGSVFSLVLPSAVEGVDVTAGLLVSADENQEGRSYTVVYVDDDQKSIGSVRKRISFMEGTTLIIRRTLEKGIKAVVLMKPDILLVNERIAFSGETAQYFPGDIPVPVAVVSENGNSGTGNSHCRDVVCLDMNFNFSDLQEVIDAYEEGRDD